MFRQMKEVVQSHRGSKWKRQGCEPRSSGYKAFPFLNMVLSLKHMTVFPPPFCFKYFLIISFLSIDRGVQIIGINICDG